MATEGFRIARSADEYAQHIRIRDDLAKYPGVAVFVAIDPDDPEGLAATVDVGRGSPCWAAVAQALRDIADRFQHEHDEGRSPCRR